MKSFLHEVAEKTVNKYPDELDKICIVVPNERTKIYFNVALAKIFNKPVWSMKVYRIRTLASEITGYNTENRIALIFSLYDVFKKYFPETAHTSYDLDQFYSLGEVLLNDFNEIDNWMVNPDQIFRNIRSIKEIESLYDYLSDEQREVLEQFRHIFSAEHISKEKEKLLQMWNIIPDIYHDFRKLLQKQKKGYNGFLMRSMSEKVQEGHAKLPNCKKFIFVGFNALSKAEMSLPKYLMKQGKAEFHQDTDAYYHLDPKQEAGYFLRKNSTELKLDMSEIPQRIFKAETGQSKEKRKIKIYGVPQNIGQAKIIPKLLAGIEKPEKSTVIISADENLMLPILYSLPESIDNVNVSMGYSLKETKLMTLIRLYLKIHNNDDSQSASKRYDYKIVQSILMHPAVQRYEPYIAEQINRTINEQSPISIPAKDLIKNEKELYRLLFSVVPKENSGIILLTNLMNIMFLIFEREKERSMQAKETIENEAIFHTYVKIKKLKELLSHRPEHFDIKFTSQLLQKVINEVSIPFKGKKATGLQVLGVLETRNIDFDNVIVLGMNEGNFPKIQSKPSFLTQSIRFAFDLPLVQHQDAVYAYLFYRLLHRSKTISFVYNNLSSAETGEKSRFIQQLEFESDFEFEEQQYYQEIKIGKPEQLQIDKNNDILKKLEKYNFQNNTNGKHFSASALNTYIVCPIRYYFNYIARLREHEKADAEISPALFGNILHKAAEIMYVKMQKGNTGKIIKSDDLKEEYKNAKQYITLAIIDEGKNTEAELFEGKGEIIREVLTKYLQMVIKTDQAYAPFQIYSLEEDKKYETYLEIETEQGTKKVCFAGIIDRVDIKDGIFRIIDYKTGKAEKTFPSFDALFDKEENGKDKAVLQMYLYGLMFKSHKPGSKIKPGIYNLRDMNKSYFSADIQLKESSKKGTVIDPNTFNNTTDEFTEKLKELVSEIFSPNIPFTQTQDDRYCTYCPYISICGR